MSRETLQHLNTNTLIGNTDQRGNAWHCRADLQTDQPNHYPGPIPIEDVRRRLFGWHAESRRIAQEVPADVDSMTHLSEDGLPMRWLPIPDRQAISRSDNNQAMGIFASGYERHQYDEWLLTTAANILDDDLCISSAGLLREGAIAWVEVSVPESVTTPQGVTFRPNLLATTSFDGSIATTFKRTVTDTVCDNTRECALAEKGQAYKVKYSRHSRLRLADARAALQMIHTLADEFAAEIAQLCATPVSDLQFRQFLNFAVPTTDDKGAALTGRALTTAQNKRATINKLYRYDSRCAPWIGTAHGVIQAINTYEHHENTVRGVTRADRNMLRTLTGEFGTLDRTTWTQLNQVLAVTSV